MKRVSGLFLALFAGAAAAGVYKWTDEQGRAHYSDAPPPAANATRLKLQSYSGPAEVSQSRHTDRGVTLYTTDWCGVCKRAKSFMQANGIPFSEWDVEKSDYGLAKFRQLGGQGVPLITVGSRKMMGFDPGRLMRLWQDERSPP